MGQHDGALGDYTSVLAALIENAPIRIAMIDRDFRFVMVDDALVSPKSLASSRYAGRLVSEVAPGLWPTLEPIFRRVLEGETILDADVSPTPAGSMPQRWRASFYPVRQSGEIIGIGAVGSDVTHLRNLEEALQQRNDLYAMLVQTNAAVGRSQNKAELFRDVCEIAVTTGGFRFAWIGEPHEGHLRLVASAGNDNGYLKTLEQADRMISLDPADPRAQGPTGVAIREGSMQFVNDYFASPITVPWQDLAGRAGFHSAAAIPILEHGEPVAVLTLYATQLQFFTDELVGTLAELPPALSFAMDRFAMERIRERDQADLLLRDRALRAATQGVVVTDAQLPDNPIIFVTPAFETLTGYTSDEAVGKNCRFLQGEDTDPAVVAELNAAMEAGRPYAAEMLNYRKNGEPFWIGLSIAPIFDDDGVLTHFVGVQTDVTDRRKIEGQMRQAQKMEAVGQLAGGIAHDFNNILTVIRGAADLALEDLDEGPARELVAEIDVAAKHAAELTQQMLAFSRRQVLQLQSTDLNAVVHETVGIASRVIGENIDVTEQLGDGQEAVLVDRGQLQQVIFNLAINARDAMPDGGKLEFRTSCCELDESYVARGLTPAAGTFALLEITDNGKGMDDELKANVFEPFFTTKAEGTGLGLATVYGIVKQSGGHIEIYSEPGIGTTFKIYLPTTSDALAPLRSKPVAGESLDGSETILHVEDSEMLRPLVARVLGRHGYQVLTAGNAERALELVKEHKGEIDLLLTDIVMPGINGRELAELLTAENPDLEVIFTSGYAADMVIQLGTSEAEVNFIQKPFLVKDLLPVIRSLLDARAATPKG